MLAPIRNPAGCGQHQIEVIGHDHKFMQEEPTLSSILRKNIHQKLSHAIGLKKRDVRLSSKSRKTYGLIVQLGAFSPGLKPFHCKLKRSRGLKTRSPGLKVRGWHGSSYSLLQIWC
jgi:hypothetical protein